LRNYGGLKSHDVKNFEEKFAFVAKTTAYGKSFENSVPEVFIATPTDVLCSNIVKFGPREMGEIVRCIHDKINFARLSSCRYWADRSQNLLGQSPTVYSECSRFHPNRFTFGEVIAERVNTAKTHRKVNSIFC